MAMCNRTPLNPTAMEAAAITAGPVINRTAMANVATEFPQAMILGCRAMNKPTNLVSRTQFNAKRRVFKNILDNLANNHNFKLKICLFVVEETIQQWKYFENQI